MRILSIALCLASLGLGAGVARAGDGSATEVIGFSPDGRYFAFEQYLEQDGSGARIAEIFIIDVEADRYVPGTPVRAAWNPEAADHDPKAPERSIADVRRDVAGKAGAILQKLAIGRNGSRIATVEQSRPRELLGPIHIDDVRGAVVRELALGASLVGPDARLRLREIDLEAASCENLVREGRPKGLALTLERGGMPAQTLALDKTIPRSRGCPSHYGISEVYAAPARNGRMALAVLIQYFYFAFEGDDRRFIAVTSLVRSR